MSIETNESKSPPQGGLFGEDQVAEQARPRGPLVTGRPRLVHAQRDQIELRTFELDSVLPQDHPARSVWDFVQALDLKPLYSKVRSVEGSAGAPAIDPAILMALWLWATIDGVGSAREVDRLCERDHAYQWLCGGVGVNYHTLADFRTAHAAWLDEQLTRSITALMDRRLVTLEVVSQDGLRVRAAAKASSFRRRGRLLELQEAARGQVEALKTELEADAGASSRRKQAARERAVRERAQRLEQALGTLEKIKQGALDKALEKSLARSARNKSGKRRVPDAKDARQNEGRQNEGTSNGGTTALAADESTPQSESKQARVSVTDPEARVMKMADGGFRPAFNVQLAVDESTQLIAGVAVVNEGSDMHQMSPMHEQLMQRYGHAPGHWLADGGFAKYEAIETLMSRDTQPVVPPSHSRKAGYDPLTPKASDTESLARWRALMASSEGQTMYRRRAASVECANAQLRRRGLTRFNVRGMLKARAVALWHALAHNLMRMRSLGIALAV